MVGCNPHSNTTDSFYLTKLPIYGSTVTCHSNAICDAETHQCKCRSGYLGDGILSCESDRWDCAARGASLCSVFADCIGKRCRCHAGYTGDGFTCMQMQPEGVDDCLACHCKAKCVGTRRQCVCERGYLGNGLLCLPDPEDCQNYPNICEQNAICNSQTRRCVCKTGLKNLFKYMKLFLGYFGQNGVNCKLVESCHYNSKLCHKNSQCLINGECQCMPGFSGDGRFKCEKSTINLIFYLFFS